MKYVLKSITFSLVAITMSVAVELPTVLISYYAASVFYSLITPFVLIGYIIVYEIIEFCISKKIKAIIQKYFIVFLIIYVAFAFLGKLVSSFNLIWDVFVLLYHFFGFLFLMGLRYKWNKVW